MVKFVYFDVGGVAIKDFSATNKWRELQHDIGVRPEDEKKFHQIWMKYRNRICIDYEVDKMIPELNAEIGLSIPKNYSLLQGFVERFEKNESIWPVITHIHKYTKIGLLTNMYLHMFQSIEKKGILPPIQWDSILDSSVLKLQKPEKELFAFAEKEIHESGKDILFIDNQEGHVSAAKQYGWQTFLYDSADYESSSRLLGEFFDHVRIL
jgi:FMN phosphatase YigB (HAD superfamily)